MMSAAIVTHDLSKTFENGVEAVKDLNLEVAGGEIFGFLGPNGAGKTTTIRLLNGTLTPSRGESTVLGIDSRDDLIRSRTATLAELAQMYGNMTLYANLLFFARMYAMPVDEAERRIREQLQRMELWEKRDLKLGSFSTGMMKKAAIARVLLHSPEIVFLDEPTAGLDPEASRQVVELIRNLAREDGITVFMCTHNLALAETVCDTFGFLSHGKLIAAGSRRQLIDSTWGERRIHIRTTRRRYTYPFRKDSEINDLIRRVMDAGEHVVGVTDNRPSLEDIYFGMVSDPEEHEQK